MQFELCLKSHRFSYNSDNFIDASYCLFKDSLNAYGLAPAERRRLYALEDGAAVQCDAWCFSPHGHTTHLETGAHILAGHRNVEALRLNRKTLVDIYRLRSVALLSTNESYGGQQSTRDKVVTAESMDKVFKPQAWQNEVHACWIIVDPPIAVRDEERINYSGSNPPYFTEEAVKWLRLRYEILMTNLPSIDREDDGGTTPNHRLFFANPENLIVELTRPREIDRADAYLLELQHGVADTDAVPVRPLVYPLSLMRSS